MRAILLTSGLLLALLLSACARPTSAPAGSAAEEQPQRQAGKVETPPQEPTAVPEATATTPPTATPPEADRPPLGAASEFSTDFSKHSVPYTEILSGGPPKDGIPAINHPKFVSVEEADAWLKPQEPVILFQIGDDARAYPLQILIWHEIVNDTVGGVPVVVTFCPLCNTAIAFERAVDGRVLDFGTTGRLRFSNLVMYDRQTESWWQQATGEAIAGELTGKRLKFLPAAIISWEEFKTAHPDGKVLSRETGYRRPYGRNPYTGYDSVNRRPFLYQGPETPGLLPPMARVITVDLNGEAVAYPYDVLQKVHVVNDSVGGVPIAVFWEAGTASALDAEAIPQGRDVGTANTFSRVLDGETLTFRYEDGRILDDQTGSAWNVLGEAVAGKLKGRHLEPVVSINHFWFSWAAFRPDTRVYQP